MAVESQIAKNRCSCDTGTVWKPRERGVCTTGSQYQSNGEGKVD
jgi:hypothetical protein